MPPSTKDEPKTVFVRFTDDYEVKDGSKTKFVKGEVYELSPESAAHHINRGRADQVEGPPDKKGEVKVKADGLVAERPPPVPTRVGNGADTLPLNSSQQPQHPGDGPTVAAEARAARETGAPAAAPANADEAATPLNPSPSPGTIADPTGKAKAAEKPADPKANKAAADKKAAEEKK